MFPYHFQAIVNSFSVFNIEDNSNKKYRADFEDNEDHFCIGYIDGKLEIDFNFKKRRYWRTAGGTMHLNTIIPECTKFDDEKYMNKVIESHLGEFDLSKIM